MLDLKQLTTDVCQIATEVGHFLKEERKNFRRERVEEKHAHDYVSYVDKASEKRIVSALKELLPEAGFRSRGRADCRRDRAGGRQAGLPRGSAP